MRNGKCSSSWVRFPIWALFILVSYISQISELDRLVDQISVISILVKTNESVADSICIGISVHLYTIAMSAGQ